jgi:hypothetical protein
MSQPAPVEQPRPFVWSAKAQKICLGLIGIGIVAFIAGLVLSPQRAWANFLLNYYFWLCIGLCGFFFVALQHITGSTWSIPIRRIAEVFMAFLPVAAGLFIILLFGMHSLYEWTHAEAVAHDPILQAKSAYLNTPFFAIRNLALFALTIFGGWAMVKRSLTQDTTRDATLTHANIRMSAPFLFLFAWIFTFVSFDLIMSLSPHWFSTIFGIYCWSGLFFSGVAMMTIWVVRLRTAGYFGSYVTDEHYHGLGKLMWAFMIFWAYIAFSQFMLIWYANIPEETPFLILRVSGPWKSIALALMIGKFWIPIFAIITQRAKRNGRWLFVVACWYLAAQWLDLYWLIFPTFFTHPIFGPLEVCMFAGFAGLFVLTVGRCLSRVPVVAYGDPQIVEGVVHHQ